jgi:hypothetical protein
LLLASIYYLRKERNSIDNEYEGDELEDNLTVMNEQPLENQENQEDGCGEMQLVNVAPVAKRRIPSIQAEEKWTDKYFVYCMMGLAHVVLFARRQSIVLNEQI